MDFMLAPTSSNEREKQQQQKSDNIFSAVRMWIVPQLDTARTHHRRDKAKSMSTFNLSIYSYLVNDMEKRESYKHTHTHLAWFSLTI